jgi:ABC-type dipeptide/oligopeptide/nickel transport system permease component
VLDARQGDFVRTARAKGLPEARVLGKHVLREAAPAILAVGGVQLGSFLGGAVVAETVFAWPGLGRLGVQAVLGRDYPVVQAAVLVATLLVVAVHLVLDVLHGVLDPRVRG